MPMTSDETETYWHQAYIEKAKERAEVQKTLETQEGYIKILESVLRDAQAALHIVTELDFEEDLAKFGADQKTLNTSSLDAIQQYQEMITLCEKALARVNIAVDKVG